MLASACEFDGHGGANLNEPVCVYVCTRVKGLNAAPTK